MPSNWTVPNVQVATTETFDKVGENVPTNYVLLRPVLWTVADSMER